ncbi:hypothetical protein KR084_005748, partial [Drosophila pseudotakahashii]
KKVLRITARYEGLICALNVRNAVLEDRHKQSVKTLPPPPQRPVAVAVTAPHSYAAAYPRLPTPSAVSVPLPRKPRETWSAVVHSPDLNISGKQLAEKVRKEIAPALGVRVHEVRELKRGGAIIHQAEMTKVVASAKFSEVGVMVYNTATKPRVTVQDVDTTIGHEEFMTELREKNFEGWSLKDFQKAVVLATKPWSAANGATINVTLEVDDQA